MKVYNFFRKWSHFYQWKNVTFIKLGSSFYSFLYYYLLKSMVFCKWLKKSSSCSQFFYYIGKLYYTYIFICNISNLMKLKIKNIALLNYSIKHTNLFFKTFFVSAFIYFLGSFSQRMKVKTHLTNYTRLDVYRQGCFNLQPNAVC